MGDAQTGLRPTLSDASAPPSVSREQRTLEWRAQQKLTRAAAVAQRAAAREARLAAMSDAERAVFLDEELAASDRAYQEKVQQWRRVEEALESGVRVVIDL
jgi:hypothetical protein